MDLVFSIDISSLRNKLRHTPADGVWWFSVDRHEDTISLAGQTIIPQAGTVHVVVTSMDSDPAEIFQLDDSQGPGEITLLSILNHEKGLYYSARGLQCSIDPHNYLFILVCADNVWQNIPAGWLRSWLDKINKWSRLDHRSLLVINSGNNNNKQFSLLPEEYRSLFSPTSLCLQGDQHLLDIVFWCNKKGVGARQQLSIQQQDGCRTLAQRQEAEIRPRSDERRILNNVAVPEGMSPLSEHWQLFNSSEILFSEARTAQTTMVAFSSQQNARIEPLARSIHTLHCQRGSTMKILVRENTANLRATDEHLLLACNANMVIPQNVPLSRCLAMIEGAQGQRFSRYVSEDIITLLPVTQPLKLRGFQKWGIFCNAVSNMINNPLLPTHGKGVLVVLRPIPGIRVKQVLTLCRPNRTGDIMAIGGNRLVLFLSFCRINDLDAALNHIFPLPTGDVFSDRMV